MQYLTVTRDIEGESGIVNLKVSDILFLEWSTRAERVVVHTRVGEYYMTGILKYWTSVLNNSGFTFRVVDRNSAVNVNQIEMLDSNLKIAYFDTHDLS
ncbi:LytTR family transcriptional regulator DNA-binding domain-containing protein, partial [Paenibacillus glucanolyticus]